MPGRSAPSKTNETIKHRKITRKSEKGLDICSRLEIKSGKIQIVGRRSGCCRITNAKVFLRNVSRNTHLASRAYSAVVEAKKRSVDLIGMGARLSKNFVTRSRAQSYLPTLQHQLRILGSHVFTISVGLAKQRFSHAHTLTALSFFFLFPTGDICSSHIQSAYRFAISYFHVLDTINRKLSVGKSFVSGRLMSTFKAYQMTL